MRDVTSNNQLEPGEVGMCIEGNPADLAAACAIFARPIDGIRIQRAELPSERVVLIADVFRDIDDHAVYLETQRLLEIVNGLLLLTRPQREPLKLGGSLHRQAANGSHSASVFVPGVTMRAEAGVVRVSGSSVTQPERLPSREAQIFALARVNERVREALGYLSGAPTFVDLYKIYELVRRDTADRFAGVQFPPAFNWHPRRNTLRKDANYERHSSVEWPGISPDDGINIETGRVIGLSIFNTWMETYDIR